MRWRIAILLALSSLMTAAHAAPDVRAQVGSESPEPPVTDGPTQIFSDATGLKVLIGLGVVIVLFAAAVTIGLLMPDRTRLGRWARGGDKPRWRSPTPEFLRWIGLGRFR